MSKRVDFHNWRPSAQQEMLLSAALCNGGEAAAHLRAWSATIDLEQLDAGSRRLLPMLYRNLKEQRIAFESIDQFKKAYLDTWARNQVLLARLSAVLRAFEAAGIPTLVLKGASLVTRFYGDRGSRPMHDIDVLVPTPRAMDAVALLRVEGWDPERKPDATFGRYLSVNHGLRLWDAARNELDLHWHVLSECLGPDADDSFWEAAAPTEINGARTLVLCPTDELLHTCIHGVRWNPVPPVRWVADAYTILRSGEEIDWDRLVVQARQRRLILTMKAALGYLQQQFKAGIPAGVLDRLDGMTVSVEESREWRSRMSRPGWTLNTPPFLWAHYPRLARDTGRSPTVLGFLSYLQAVWDLDHLWQVPFAFAMRSLDRLLGRTPA